MLSKYTIFSLLAASSSLLPSLASAKDPVLVPWSQDPKQCYPTYACAADCAQAYQTLCAQITSPQKAANPLKLDAQRVVVKSCLAYYHLGSVSAGKPNAPFANAAACEQAFANIVTTTSVIYSDPKIDPQKCGRPAGAMGYDEDGARTATPLYALMPANGNPNCFKRIGDTSPITPANQLADGSTLKTCPRSTSKRTDVAIRDAAADDVSGWNIVKCGTEDILTLTACTATCITSVLATSWITGFFAVIAGLGCVGLCDVVAVKVADNCMESSGGDLFHNFFDWTKKRDLEPLTLGGRLRDLETRAPAGTGNDCLRLQTWNVCDQTTQNALLKNAGCETVGGNVIHF
ncbi:MAG: hypothetical protein M1812_003976 [Candelaria pacifica]|nr:MAG: hypothetical protein M1812_003976 [Candelaria pacifica]